MMNFFFSQYFFPFICLFHCQVEASKVQLSKRVDNKFGWNRNIHLPCNKLRSSKSQIKSYGNPMIFIRGGGGSSSEMNEETSEIESIAQKEDEESANKEIHDVEDNEEIVEVSTKINVRLVDFIDKQIKKIVL